MSDHPWDVHDDFCECHITICPDCGCTNEVVEGAASPSGASPDPLGCGYFAPCEQDAEHDGPHTPGMYPEWQVPTMEPMAFVHPPASVAPDLSAAVREFLHRWDNPERYHRIPAVDDLRVALGEADR